MNWIAWTNLTMLLIINLIMTGTKQGDSKPSVEGNLWEHLCLSSSWEEPAVKRVSYLSSS